MTHYINRILISLTLVILIFSKSLTALSEDNFNSNDRILTRYTIKNHDGTTTECLLDSNDIMATRKDLNAKGCTLETLRKDQSIDVEMTLVTSSGFNSFFINSKYYLMWVNTGVHALNLVRYLPFAFTSLIMLHPIDSMKHLSFAALYNVGLYHNARSTLYPFLKNRVYNYFFPEYRGESRNHKDSKTTTDSPISKKSDPEDNSPTSKKSTYQAHLLVIGIDIFMWWIESITNGRPDINKLMVILDSLILACDLAITEENNSESIDNNFDN